MVKGRLSQPGTVLGLLQLLLGLSELGQVEGGDLLRLLDLPLEVPQLHLQLVHQLLHVRLDKYVIIIGGETAEVRLNLPGASGLPRSGTGAP